ncbi:MAG TPA: hypothetical protein VMT22_24470 [Terriglobales bacterium]|jgi:hypothetical protein|nr:hypothetical protein [Terriglobales bacterium]
MEVNINNHEVEPEGDASYNYWGKGLQFLVQTPVFIAVGIIVIIWEMINKLFHAVYQQGAQMAAPKGASQGEAGPVKVKVPMMPIDNYSRLDIEEIIHSLEGLTPTDLDIVKNFELSHGNRQVIIDAIDQRLTGVH